MRHKFYRAMSGSRPSSRVGMFIRLYCLFVNAITMTLCRVSTPHLLQMVSHISVHRLVDGTATPAELEAIFANTIAWLPMSSINTCLPRAAALTWILRRHGYQACLTVGYRPSPFEAHAWVELDERVIGDHPGYKRRFLPLGTW